MSQKEPVTCVDEKKIFKKADNKFIVLESDGENEFWSIDLHNW